VTVLAVEWTEVLAVVALVVAVVALAIASFCIYGLVRKLDNAKAAQKATADE
jgi:hypothetical protein